MTQRRFLVHTADDFNATQGTSLPFAFHRNGGDPESFVSENKGAAKTSAHNGCASTPTTSPSTDAPDGEAPDQNCPSSDTVLEWEDCGPGARAVHVRMNNIGHDMHYDMIVGGTMPYMYNFLIEARR